MSTGPCSVVDCRTDVNNKHITFFSFPPGPPGLRRVWIKFCARIRGWEPNVNATICSVHFEKSCFHEYNPKRLLSDSIPTLRPIYVEKNIPDTCVESTFTYCSVLNCENGESQEKNDPEVSYHPFPNIPEVLKRWIKFCERPSFWRPYKNDAICSRHFKRNDYLAYHGKTRILHKYSIPTIMYLENGKKLYWTVPTTKNIKVITNPNRPRSKVIKTKLAFEDDPLIQVPTTSSTADNVHITKPSPAMSLMLFGPSGETSSQQKNVVNEGVIKYEPQEETESENTITIYADDSSSINIKEEPLDIEESNPFVVYQHEPQKRAAEDEAIEPNTSPKRNRTDELMRESIDDLSNQESISKTLDTNRPEKSVHEDFGVYVASLMRALPMRKAVVLQAKIVDMVTKAIVEEDLGT